MTDNDIIKIYEGLTSNQQLNLFRNFYYNDGFSTEKGIVANAINDILPKYCKQQEEIEQWKEEATKYQNLWCIAIDNIEKAKSKSVKEFAEKLKEIVKFTDDTYECWEIEGYIDNLVKELVGEK